MVPLNLYSVTRPKDTVIVAIMLNEQDNKYHYVNLSHNHICSCAFDSIQNAIADMDNKITTGDVLYYHKL